MNLTFPSTLIIHNSPSQVVIKITEILKHLGHLSSENNPDICIIDQKTGWTIENIRSLKNFLSKKPFNHDSKIIIIQDADKLNTESQNAILKTLEEPGEGNYIILTTQKPAKLLTTIISRCHIIKIRENKITDQSAILISPTNNIATDLTTSEKLATDKESVLIYLQNQLELYQQLLIKQPNIKNQKTIEKIIKSMDMINSNVDAKSSIDYFFLS